MNDLGRVRMTEQQQQQQIDPGYVDSMLAKELHQMSFQDRIGIEEEIHGVHSMAVKETPDLINECMVQFQRELDATTIESKQAYEEALHMNEASRMYVQDWHFRLKFLRAERLDVKAAVRRFLLLLDGLKRYYGSFALERPLRHNDLDKSSKDLLRAGGIQVLPSRDRAGRLIIVTQGTMTHATASTKIKMLLYFFQVLSDDVEAQKQGLVFILSADVKLLSMEIEDMSDPEKRIAHIFLRDAIPVRSCAFHFCLPNDGSLAHQLIWALFMLQVGSSKRVRTRFHNPPASVPGMGGIASTEVQYLLMTFGINVQDLPITSGGQIKTKNHIHWIKTRKAIELVCEMEATRAEQLQQQHLRQQEQDQNMFLIPSMMAYTTIGTATPPNTFSRTAFLDTMIVHPGIHDVLLLKGGSMHHWGNIEFQSILAARVEEYITTPSRSVERKGIRAQIINSVHDRGGRFLMVGCADNDCMTKSTGASGGSWWVVNTDLPDLHDRISTALYDLNRKLQGKKKMQISKSVTSEFSGLADNSGTYKRRKVIVIGPHTDSPSVDEEDYDRNCADACGGGFGGFK